MVKWLINIVKAALFRKEPYKPDPMSPKRKYIAKLWLWQGATVALMRLEQLEIIDRLHAKQSAGKSSKEMAV